MSLWEAWADKTLMDLQGKDLLRQPRVTDASASTVLFSTNDYLGLSTHEDIIRAGRTAWSNEGSGPRASALISGRSPAHDRLESQLATLKRTETSLLFPSGYAANLGLLSALAGPDLAIFSDAGNHASIIDGCNLARRKQTEIRVFAHCNMADLKEQLIRCRRPRKLIVSDSLFSMTGKKAPLGSLVELAKETDAQLHLDEAHATLIFGAEGGGLAEAAGVSGDILFQCGTLSKAFGQLGGFVATNNKMKQLLFNQGRSQVFSTALPVPTVVAATQAIPFGMEDSTPRRRLAENIGTLANLLQQENDTPIFTIPMPSPRFATEASTKLLDLGFAVPAIRPPTVADGDSKLRLSVTAAHSPEELKSLAAALCTMGICV